MNTKTITTVWPAEFAVEVSRLFAPGAPAINLELYDDMIGILEELAESHELKRETLDAFLREVRRCDH